MPDIDEFYDRIDSSRARRARELSNLKESFRKLSRSGQADVAGKSVIVLTYANWEGFYNECVDCLLDFLTFQDVKIASYCWTGLTGALSSNFSSIRDKNHSLSAKRDFVECLPDILVKNFADFDRKIAKSQSNLNFERLQIACSFIGLVPSNLQSSRNRIDKELVAWRHSIAHGDSIDLTLLQADEHVDFTSRVMLLTADTFQEAMLSALP